MADKTPPETKKGVRRNPDAPISFRPYFTSSKGKVFWAKDYGHVSWPIPRRQKRK